MTPVFMAIFLSSLLAGGCTHALSGDGTPPIPTSAIPPAQPAPVNLPEGKPSGLYGERVHVFLDFSIPGKLQVGTLLLASNPSSQTFTPPAPDIPLLSYELPSGFKNLGFEGGTLGERFLPASNGFGDLQSIPPGQNQYQAVFSYELEYPNSLELSMRFPLDVKTSLVALPTQGISLQSSQLTDYGQREVEGILFQFYIAGPLRAGEPLTLSISGLPRQDSQLEQGTTLQIGIGAVALLAALGLAFWSLKSPRQPVSKNPDDLLDSILDLEDAYHAGSLDEKTYRSRRDKLEALWRKQQ